MRSRLSEEHPLRSLLLRRRRPRRYSWPCERFSVRDARHFLSRKLSFGDKGIEHWNLIAQVRHAKLSFGHFCSRGEAAVRRIVVFLKMPNGEATRDETSENFAQRMIPSDVLMLDRSRSIGIRSGAALDDGPTVKIGEFDLLELFIEHPHERVKLDEH